MWRGLAAIVLCAGSGFACGSSPPETASVISFCASADTLFNKGTFAADGGGVVEALRKLDVSELVGANQEAISKAIDIVEANIDLLNRGQAPDGWSTEPVTTVAARICGSDMTSFFAVP